MKLIKILFYWAIYLVFRKKFAPQNQQILVYQVGKYRTKSIYQANKLLQLARQHKIKMDPKIDLETLKIKVLITNTQK